MSELKEDKKRKVKQMEDRDGVVIKVPPAQRIAKDLAKKLRSEKVGEKIRKVWEQASANRREWLNRLVMYQQDLDEYKYLEESRDHSDSNPEGISQLHIPMPLTVIKTVHARFMQALVQELAPQVVPRRADSVQAAPVVKSVMEYMLKDWANQNQGVEEELDKFVWDWVSAGDAVMKVRWETIFDSYKDVANFVEDDEPLKEVTKDGQIISVPNFKVRQEEVKRLTKRFDGPVFEHKNLEDVIIVGAEGDPQKADYVLDNYMLTASELRTFAHQGSFDAEEVEEVINSGPDSQTGETHTELKERRRENASEGSINSEPDYDRYRIIEAYFGYDVDGTGIDSQVVAWIHPTSGRVLRATYLHRMNKSGERPYFKAKYLIRKGQEHGLGLLEILHPLSIEMDFHHNTRIDFGLFSAMPFGFYRASSSMDKERFKPEPGDLIPMEDPQNDVFYPNLGNRTAFGVQEEQAIQSMVERVTGVNDMTLGTLTGAQGPTRTATGVRGLLGESNTNLDVHLRRLNRFWKQVLRYSLHLLQQRIPPGFEFKIVGEDGNLYFPRIREREDIRGDFDFELAPSSATSNPQIQQDRANFIVQLQNNPLYLTLGIVTPQNVWEGAKALLQAIGVKDPHRYITKPQGYRYVPTPEEEANRILRGQDVPVLPEGDHEGFIEYVNFLMSESTPDGAPLLAQFSQQEVARLAAQANKHQEMIDALQVAQQQTNNSGQQIQNALQGVVQANVNLQTPQTES